jgi:predicted house-cleaning noncanonical NTP pyrophosphatase (MazG superfamily)
MAANKKIYNKLVRDKIPNIIAADGKKFKSRILDDKAYLQELIKKLHEEVKEFEENPSVEELADIKELTIAIRQALGIHAGDLEDTRRQKAAINGRFKQKIFLEFVED